jgi:hypothetical protein
VTACGSHKQSPAEAKQQLCASLDDFAASVVDLQGLGLSSSEDDITSALNKIDDAWNKVVDSAKNVKTVNTDNLRSAYDGLKRAVQNRPTDKPLTEVVAGLEPHVHAFAQAWKDFGNSLDCKTTS